MRVTAAFVELPTKDQSMKSRSFTFLILLSSVIWAPAQDFPYGAISLNDLGMDVYPADTSAGAVVLQEFGHALISNGDSYNLIFRYHARIKILKKNGLSESNIEVALRKQGNNLEKMTDIKASSFNLEGGRIREAHLDVKDVFSEDVNKYYQVRKFAIPGVREGSIIELSYTIESPFIYNFRTWEFQSHIPKIRSEYWASIPGIYLYNITLRGFLKLTKNESSIVRNCLGTAQGPLTGGFSADCALMKWAIKDVPAFREEQYMTTTKNFISAVRFELSEVRHPDGRIDKVTKEWKDAEQEMRQDDQFGVQLRRGKDIGNEVEKIIALETDELVKATKVYDFIRDWYVWNDTYGKYSEFGIKKAFDARTGNVGDINLSLVAALRFAGLDVEPVILSTRANGTVMELYPVLSEFNYVIAKVNIGDKVYLADATAKYHPFGLLPERCLNGKGRVMPDRDSYWIELKPTEARKTVSQLSLVLGTDGVMRGTLTTNFSGYDAVAKRQEILSYPTQEEYITALKNKLGQMIVTGFTLTNVDDMTKHISRTLNVELRAFDEETVQHFLFDPFMLDKWSENPFKSKERLYPVDFGAPLERVTIFNLEYPAEFEIANLPEKVGLALPNAGGRFMFEARNMGNRISLSNFLSIRKTVFSSTEYHYLKELFDRIIQVQNSELIFKRKT